MSDNDGINASTSHHHVLDAEDFASSRAHEPERKAFIVVAVVVSRGHDQGSVSRRFNTRSS